MTNKVFFTGAGFSKSINSTYPLLYDLTQKVTREFEKDILGEYYKSNIAKKMQDNLEYLLTYLSTDLPWKDEKTKAMNKALYLEITENIQEVFRELEINISTKTNFLEYNSLAKYIIDNNVQTITLNYDLMFEKIVQTLIPGYNNIRYFYNKIILNLEERYTPGRESTTVYSPIGYKIIDWTEIGRDTSTAKQEEKEYKSEDYPKILKLHGSINWLYDPISPSNPIYCLDNIEEVPNNNYGLTPYIIPPVLDKNGFYNNNILKGIWQQAHEFIKNADEIYIIGFSFPPTDLSLKYLFQSALREKNDIKIYVINYDSKNDTRKTYESIFELSQLACNVDGNSWKYLGVDGFQKFIKDIINK